MRRRNVKNAHERLIQNNHVFIENPIQMKGTWHTLFNNQNPIHIEIGMGKGDFIIELAKRNPQINYLGIEKYESVLIQAVDKAKNLGLNNLYLLCFDASSLTDIFDENEIDKIYLNFSDPWPKDRHAKRRLTSSIFLARYDNIFKGHKKIIMKTDNNNLFDFSLNSLLEYGYNIDYSTTDLHRDKENIITTEYEDKFTSNGIKINYLEASKE